MVWSWVLKGEGVTEEGAKEDEESDNEGLYVEKLQGKVDVDLQLHFFPIPESPHRVVNSIPQLRYGLTQNNMNEGFFRAGLYNSQEVSCGHPIELL
ncbi:hypothetical protein SUGI_0512100 [Cryptomeria japonica]|nr:hypothetical protein SUGI_0512100 [Cryptomeria japonica]